MSAPDPTIYLLYGYPGTGKLTVANQLVSTLNGQGRTTRLVDNHTINDPVFRVVDADGKTPLGPVVWGQIGKVREAVLEVMEQVSPFDWSFVFTNVLLDDPEDLAWMERYADLAAKRDSRFLLVKLTIDQAENERRIAIPERRERLKMTSIDGLREMRESHRLPHPGEHELLEINVTEISPWDAVALICEA